MNTDDLCELFSQLAVYLIVFRPDAANKTSAKCSSEHYLHSAVLNRANLLGVIKYAADYYSLAYFLEPYSIILLLSLLFKCCVMCLDIYLFSSICSFTKKIPCLEL